MNGEKVKLSRIIPRVGYVILGGIIFLLLDVHERILWLLLIFHCYTDCRSGTVYCFPTYICIVVESIIYISALICGRTDISVLFQLVVCIGIILFFSRVIHAYSDGDEEIYIMLVLAAANMGKDVLFYGIYLLGVSGTIFIICRLWELVINFISAKRHGNRKSFAMEAPMLPAILAAYIMAAFQWRNL